MKEYFINFCPGIVSDHRKDIFGHGQQPTVSCNSALVPNDATVFAVDTAFQWCCFFRVSLPKEVLKFLLTCLATAFSHTVYLSIVGPYKVNGVPLRRVAQAYVISTSVSVDLSNFKIPEHLNDQFFKREPRKKKRTEDMFEDSQEVFIHSYGFCTGILCMTLI